MLHELLKQIQFVVETIEKFVFIRSAEQFLLHVQVGFQISILSQDVSRLSKMLQAHRLFTSARLPFTPCIVRWRANDAAGPSAMPTKFSETSAYLRRGRQGVQKLG